MKMVKKYWLFLMLTTFVVSCRNSNVGVSKDADDQRSTTFYQTRTAEVEKVKKPSVTQYELPAPLTDRPEQILKRRAYTTSYNNKSKTPNWVAWHLTKAHTYGDHQRKNEVFFED